MFRSRVLRVRAFRKHTARTGERALVLATLTESDKVPSRITPESAVRIAGTGATDQSARGRVPADLARSAVATALSDAGTEASAIGLVLVSNVLGGLLSDQESIRGQAWLRGAGLDNAFTVNIENACAGGGSAVHLGVQAAQASGRPVLVVGVEQMLTGDREGTLHGISQCIPSHERSALSALHEPSIFMGLNAEWAQDLLDHRGHTIEQIAATTVKARRLGAANPIALHRTPVSIEEVLASPVVAAPLTRLMCSSFTDGAAAVVLDPTPGYGPTIRASIGASGSGELGWHERIASIAKAAFEEASIAPGDLDVIELHDASSAEELYALESVGLFPAGEAGEATVRGETDLGGKIVVNPSGGLIARGHPLGATGILQVAEVADQLRGRAGPRQVENARLGMTLNAGGLSAGDIPALTAHVIEI